MYVGSIFEYDDQSQIATLPVANTATNPLYLSLFSSDKGTEDWTVLNGEDWFKMYGKNISFDKHGQPLLQAAISINAGASLLSKRLVAEDATLANLSIVASVSSSEVQDTNKYGEPIYYDDHRNETTEKTDNPKMIKRANIKYTALNIANIVSNNIDDVVDAVKSALTENDYLIYTFADNGRGVSNKRVQITPNYRISKSKNYIEYFLVITENGENLESINFSPIPDLVVSGGSHALNDMVKTYSNQIRCYQDNDQLNKFIKAIANASGKEIADVKSVDFLLGKNNKGINLNWINVDISTDPDHSDGININSIYGQALTKGDNGSFGNSPLTDAVDEYCEQAAIALGFDSNGARVDVYDTDIYNVDKWKIELSVDANYPEKIKNSIENLVNFREDFTFLRDFGTGLSTIGEIQNVADSIENRNKFIDHYCTSYDIIDPYSKKQITVTIGMALARLMIDHLINRRSNPVAGIKNNMIIDDAIKGTVSFRPVVCPDPIGNQKEALEDMRVNYATYIGDDLVIETEYTSQEEHTQFSYLNNILLVQELVRAIRNRCPIIRYSFLNGEDLERYKKDIEDVIDKYKSNFKTVEFEYTADPTYINNKIFYATLKISFPDFVQTEWFKITAINVEEV